MLPFFNTSGPCIPGEHYMLPPERRLGDVLALIEERRYFTLHAGRQTGKTTSLMWLERHLNATGRWCALWVDLQTARETPDVQEAMTAIFAAFERTLAFRHPRRPRLEADERTAMLATPKSALLAHLTRLAELDPLPLVLLLDEADGLVGEAMVSFLTQLRHGYIERSLVPFPASVVLVGQRQVRDYAMREEDRKALAWLGTTSPFNITAEATTLGPFTEAEVGELLEQHTTATGQRFSPEAVARIGALGRGHPWLTNALADQIVRRDVTDRAVELTAAHVEAAKETIILERRTHIDSLVARLREERVRRILAPMLVGDRATGDVLDDDFAYVLGLGLLRASGGRYEIANPIYAEVLPRALTYHQQMQIANEPAWYVRPDGSLDMPKLMADWQVFWRKDGHLAADGFHYREAGPHLMLMAFLQRVVNGGGRIEREYALGRGALDLLVEWRGHRHAIELKLRRKTETETEALDQLLRYLDHVGLDEGWLVMFDLRSTMPWDERLTQREVERRGKRVHVVGC
ncbi:endonuclease NucS domain-containing protein [Paraliomyxa miuraensis]|uniref:endonuclease NucS domain-containing protein n=1 Tax=Paraliomyxa miuraensis TaxID=376150 RepID=UPI002258BC9C|nr:endonuclease NucS domain-containing protein [Paraliomyxa miuraensis]MCX4243421.1 endonuclease NucS [Paraliomyxa miuraensis]